MLNKLFSLSSLHYILFLPILAIVGCTEIDENIPHPNDLDKWEYFDASDGIGAGTIWSLYEDDDSNLWIGSGANGVYRYDGKAFVNYNIDNGLIDNTVLSIVQNNTGAMWFGTLGGLSILNSDGFSNLADIQGFPLEIFALVTDPDGNVWWGTSTLGILMSDGVQISQFFDANCNECNSINRIFLDSSGDLWFGSAADVKRYRNGSFTPYDLNDGLAGSDVTSFYEDSNGSLWIGTFDGAEITRFENGNFERISLFNSLPQNWITSITGDRLGNLWIGTGTVANGLIQYDGIVMHTIFEGPPDNSVLSMITDSNGSIWLGTSGEGLAKYIPK